VKTTALILVCAISWSAPAQEPTEVGTGVTIRALERAWVAAQSRNDNHALNQIFDNSLVYVEYGRLLSKSEYLARVRTEDSHPQQIAMEPMMVRAFGTTAIAVGTYKERGMKNGKPFVRRWRFVDTWVYKKGAWVLVAAGAAPIAR
jgi:ketosteroid isomerase-like protein